MGGADLVILPEMWNCPYSSASFPTYAEDVDGGDSPSTSALSSAAKDNNVVLVGGSVPERSGGRLYNTSFVFGRDGSMLARHRKVGKHWSLASCRAVPWHLSLIGYLKKNDCHRW